jgi:hypothetical protein
MLPPLFDRTVLPEGEWEDWRELDSTYSKTDLCKYRIELWNVKYPQQEPSVFGYAHAKDEKVVAFAILIAQNHRVMRTRDVSHATLLHILAKIGSERLVQLAIKANACCVDFTDCMGNTPYHVAASAGRNRILHLLKIPLTRRELRNTFFSAPRFILPGEGINERNKEGSTPLHLCTARASSLKENACNYRQCMRELACCVRVNISVRRGGDGNTIAHMAVMEQSVELLRISLQLGCRPSVRDVNGRTVSQLVLKNKSGEEFDTVCRNYAESLESRKFEMGEVSSSDEDEDEDGCKNEEEQEEEEEEEEEEDEESKKKKKSLPYKHSPRFTRSRRRRRVMIGILM